MNYENLLTLLIALSAILTALLGFLTAFRYRSHTERDTMERMRIFFEENRMLIEQQNEIFKIDNEILANYLKDPKSLTPDSLAQLTSHITAAAKLLEQSINSKKEFTAFASSEPGLKQAYDTNMAATKRAIEVMENLSESSKSLVEVVVRGQKQNG